MKESFASLGQKLVEFELSQIQILNQKAEWTLEVEPLIKTYNVRKEDIKNCFKLTDIVRTLSPKTLEREFMDSVSTYLSNLEQNLIDQSEILRLEEIDVAEVERMVTVVQAHFPVSPDSGIGVGSMPGRQRKRSMLPVRGKEPVGFMNPRKSMDFMIQGGPDIRNERSSPAQRLRNLHGSKSPSSKIQQYNSVNIPASFAVPDSVPNRFLNQSSFLGPLKGDVYIADTPTYNDIDGYTPKGVNVIQKTPFKGTVYNREMSPSAGVLRRFAVEDEDDINLLNSGLFDNHTRKNYVMKLNSKSSNPNFPPVMTQGNPNSAVNSFYQNEMREPIPQMSSVREGVGPQRFHTPNKIASTTKLGISARERTPERGQGRMEPETTQRASSIIGTSGVSNNRNATPKKIGKTRTPDKQPKQRNIFEQEPLRSLMKSLDSDTLHTFTLRSANLTDDHVYEICARMQHKTVLRVLDLSSNLVTDAGLTRICETIPKTNIMTLIMSNNRITNEGLKTCFGMIRAPGNRVSSISIDPCQIEKTPEGRKQIIDAFAKKGVSLKF